MPTIPVAYSSGLVKERIASWAIGLDFNPEEQLFLQFETKFGAKEVTVVDARPEGDALIIAVVTDRWAIPREFALFKSGSLAW